MSFTLAHRRRRSASEVKEANVNSCCTLDDRAMALEMLLSSLLLRMEAAVKGMRLSAHERVGSPIQALKCE